MTPPTRSNHRHAVTALWLPSVTAFAAVLANPAWAQTPVEQLRNLSLEELANLQVSTAARRPQALSQAPAAIEVITGADIANSGVQSLPEAIRLARNLQVGRVDSQNYAISARGFNSFQASNKLLVLIDGRSVYTPLYSGVFWDQRTLPLNLIERIEVISGPGGTLWGANAVNGVINIITRSSAEMQGWSAQAFVGSTDQRLDMNYGGSFGEGATYRVHATGFQRGSTLTATGDDAGDEWSAGEVGFRSDWGDVTDSFSAQGSLFERFDDGGEFNGGHLLGRWRHQFADGSSFGVRSYYSRNAAAAGGVSDELDTWDIELQHTVAMGRHQIVWGGGYRFSDSEFINTTNPSVLDPARRELRTANLFIQDEIALASNLALTAGLKVEDHTYTDIEYMPNVRLAWRPTENSLVWGAVSRAVRTPSRIDRDLISPGVIVPGGMESEDLLAYEMGYRTRPTPSSSISATLYWHEYEGVRTINLTPPGVLPARQGNGLNGPVYGAEIWGDVDVSRDWRLSAGVTLFESDLELDPLSIDFNGSGFNPDYQVFLRSRIQLAPDWTFNLSLRAIDEISPQIPAYVELDGRLAWRIGDTEIALSGFNLLDESHPESIDGAVLFEARRSVQLSASLAY